MDLPGGGSFNLGSMSGMMPSIVKMVAGAGGMGAGSAPLRPSEVSRNTTTVERGTLGIAGNPNVTYDNSIQVHGNTLSDPNQLVGPMQEQMNARTATRANPAMPTLRFNGPGGG
jgi:hypothetical protein